MKLTSLFLSLAFSSSLLASVGGDDAGNGGSNFLKRTQVNQYTCLQYNRNVRPDGGIDVLETARLYNYFVNEVLPLPVYDTRTEICHDYIKYGIEDSAEYPRLETIKDVFSLFGRFDSRFQDTEEEGKFEIDKLIERRMRDDYNINYSSKLFKKFILANDSYGFILKPILDMKSNTVFCPSADTLAISPLVKVITEFTGQTQGLYYGEMEAQKLPPINMITAYLKITEQDLLKYGFILREGEKIRLSYEDQIETETVFVYYPFNDSQDPLVKGIRKIVRIKFPSGNTLTKKLGCVFKNETTLMTTL